MTAMTSPQADPLIIGIDIGGTKTHLRAQSGRHCRDVVHVSSSWRKRDWTLDARALLELAHELADGQPVAAIAVGAHGCDDGDECDKFQAAFATQTAIPVSVVNVAELMPLAVELPGQIGLVAGTGSIAVCRPANGAMMVAGGWGWIVGDEGSAAGIVREAVRAVTLDMDRCGESDDLLAHALFAALNVPSPSRLGSELGRLGNAASVGALAHVVFDAADQGSALAREVIRQAGHGLAVLVQRLDQRGANARHVIAGGSVIAGQPVLWQAFCDALAELCNGRIAPQVFAGKPVEGACRLAETLLSAPQLRTLS